MRSPIRLVALIAGLAVASALLPVDAAAQSRRGGNRGGAVRVARPVQSRPAVRPQVSNRSYNRSYSRSYYRYRPYYGSYGFYRSYPYWWGGFGWSPYSYYSPYWAYGYGYPYSWGGGGYWGGYYRGYDPSDSQGAARLQVTPRETEVFVDGYFAGVVDDFDGFSQRLRLEPGEHDVTLFLAGHRPLSRKMLFTVGQTFRIQHAMEPLAAGEAPPERPVPSARPPAPPRRYGRQLGPRTVRTLPDGAEPTAAQPEPGEPGPDVVVEPRDQRPESRPEPRPERGAIESARGAAGTLSLRVQPEDAEIFVDGEPWAGSSGARLVVTLQPGVHRLEVRKSGHETYSGLVRVRPGAVTTLNVALSPSDAR